jgi:hypothetical protein
VIAALLAAATTQACGGIDAPSPESQSSPAQVPVAPIGDAEQEIGGISPSLFPYRTTVEDDGADVGGGYQTVTATLKFADGRQDPPAQWQCTYVFGMPLRTAKFGKIDATHAAVITALVATSASSTVMHRQTAWTPSFFCRAFRDEMNVIFQSAAYKGLGAGVFMPR